MNKRRNDGNATRTNLTEDASSAAGVPPEAAEAGLTARRTLCCPAFCRRVGRWLRHFAWTLPASGTVTVEHGTRGSVAG